MSGGQGVDAIATSIENRHTGVNRYPPPPLDSRLHGNDRVRAGYALLNPPYGTVMSISQGH